MKRFYEQIRAAVRSSVIKNTTTFKEIKHFHPAGETMPNGSHYQWGGFLEECKKNVYSFILDESVHGEQSGMAKYREGVVVFSADVNAVELDKTSHFKQ